MKTVPDLIMNPGHFQMWAPKKNPSLGGAGWRGDSSRLRLRPSSQTGWGAVSKPPPTQGVTARFKTGFGCHFLSHITSRGSAVSQLSRQALNPQDKLKVVSHKTQGQGCLSFEHSLWTTPGCTAFIQPI
jgi:hypothetical protein